MSPSGLRGHLTPFRAAIVVAVALAAIGGVVVRWNDETPTTDREGRALALTAPGEIDAGEPWTIEVTSEPAIDRDDVAVALVGPLGVRPVADLVLADGVVVIPGEFTRSSGQLVAIVTLDDAVGEISVEVRPGKAVTGIVPLAGPRSMVADRAHWTMVTSFPRDRYGNAVVDGTPVTVLVRRPDGSVEEVDSEVEHLLAAPRVFSRTTAGRTAVRIDVEGATGPEVDVLEVPGPPVEVELVAPETPLRADGRTLVPIVTGVLADRYGNVLLDGTAVEVRVGDRAGARSLSTIVVDGRAELALEAPGLPGRLEVVAEVDGTRSDALALEFELDVAELPVAVTDVVDDDVTIEIGPVTSVLGGFVADGTPVEIETRRGTIEIELRDGVAELAVDVSAGGSIVVRVLGAETRVVVP